jgi:hypothetical protein
LLPPPPPPPPPTSSLSGTVYLDNNSNGVLDAADTGLSGLSVTLTGTDSLGHAVNLTVATDSHGNYSFTGLLPGTYTVSDQGSGFVDEASNVGSQGGNGSVPGQISGITLPGGVTAVNYNFAELPAST